RTELAHHLHLTEEEIAEGQLAAHGYATRSLDTPTSDDGGASGARPRHLATTEPAYELIESLTALRPLLDRLDERDQHILELRFGEELTQAEIGRRIGLSQMHVSRLLTRILGDLREGLNDDSPPVDGPPDGAADGTVDDLPGGATEEATGGPADRATGGTAG
ncbi:sigma-70 family RNA polymerase sigma factor, partial [Streptomyces bikiniensis]|uniref:sigma-70 family RNA polymerase sigma factor n=1 Tax=Streptomyces bikiniensis TaxID=1896 RepID=UPI00131A53CA